MSLYNFGILCPLGRLKYLLWASMAVLLLSYPASKALAQDATIRITGTISGETGQPLSGVSVKVKNQAPSTSTDANGAFSLNVAPNSTLIFTYIGSAEKLYSFC